MRAAAKLAIPRGPSPWLSAAPRAAIRVALRAALRAALIAGLLAACDDGDVSDGTGGSDTSGSAASTSNASNASSSSGRSQPPTVSAGSDQTVHWPIDRVPLLAAASKGADAHWEQVSGPEGVVIRGVREAEAVATALRIGDTVLRVTVENDEGLTASDEVTIHVLPASTAPTTPIEWAASLPAPVFRVGHRLAPLTRQTGPHALELEKRLSTRYGYALDLGDTSAQADADLADPDGRIPQMIALKRLDTDAFPLFVDVWRPLLDDESAFYDEYPDMRLLDVDGEPSGPISPEAPDELFEEIAELSAARLRAIVARVAEQVPSSPRVDVVLHGGGDGLGFWSDDDSLWLDDARVRAAIEERFDLAAGELPSTEQMFAYISERKAHQEQIVTSAHVAANPGGIYAYRPTWSFGDKERDDDWWRHAWDYPTIASLSSPAGLAFPTIHYRDDASRNTGWAGELDALTQLTNAQAWQQDQGAPLQYLFTSGGWPHDDRGFEGDVIATDDSYMGYLKVAYTVGLIGGAAGYFDDPGWGEEATQTSSEMPTWLRQLVTLGEVHALFSHLEDFLLRGSLVAGPDAHRWSTGKPAYELVATRDGDLDDGVRIAARRSADGESLLVTLWAAVGEDRAITLSLDDFLDGSGIDMAEVVLQARTAGSVYLLTSDDGGVVTVRLLDPDPMLPTDTFLPSDEW